MQTAISSSYIPLRKTAENRLSSIQRAIDMLLEALFAREGTGDIDESLSLVFNKATLITLIPRKHPQAATALRLTDFLALPTIRGLVRARRLWCESARVSELSASRQQVLRVSSEIRLDNDDALGVGRKVDISTLVDADGAFPTIKSCVVVYEEEIGAAPHITHC